MESNIFLIQWFGPFETKEKVKDWESKQPFKCSLYLLHGMLKYAKTRDVYYCGMSSMRYIYERLNDKNHPIDIIERLNSIYVGYLANIKRPTKCQINLVENFITASLSYIVGKDNVLNKDYILFPRENIYVINEWWKDTTDSMWERRPKNDLANIIPSVLTCHFNGDDEIDILGCKKLKNYNNTIL